MDQFLSRLPQSVIKEGKIIDVRSGVANVIKVCEFKLANNFLGLFQSVYDNFLIFHKDAIKNTPLATNFKL